MLSRIRIPEISQRAQFLLFLFCIVALSYWAPGSMADAFIYFNGGDKLLHGMDPYDGSSPFFSAPTGAKFMYLVGKSLLITQFPFIWTVVNILGVSAFFYVVLKFFNTQRYLMLTASLLLLTAPVREMVVNNQVTGFVLGLTSLSIYLAARLDSSSGKALLFLPIFLSFELKPNLIIGFLIYYLWTHRGLSFLRCWLPIGVILVSNTMIFSNQYLRWIKNVSSQGLKNITGFESLGLSTLAYESNILGYESARMLGVVLFIFTFLFYFSTFLTKNENLSFSFAPLLTLSFPYLHLLDLIIALPFIIPRILQQKNHRVLAPILCAVIYFPRPSESGIKNLAIILLTILISGLQLRENRNFREFGISVFTGFAVVLSNLTLPLNNLSDHEIQNFTALRTWLVVCIVLLVIQFQSRKYLKNDGSMN